MPDGTVAFFIQGQVIVESSGEADFNFSGCCGFVIWQDCSIKGKYL